MALTDTDQAMMTAAAERTRYFLKKAAKEIDITFGDGFAAQNPALVATFVTAASSDYVASIGAGRDSGIVSGANGMLDTSADTGNAAALPTNFGSTD